MRTDEPQHNTPPQHTVYCVRSAANHMQSRISLRDACLVCAKGALNKKTDQLLSWLKLESTLDITNMHLFDSSGQLRKCARQGKCFDTFGVRVFDVLPNRYERASCFFSVLLPGTTPHWR